MGAEEEEESYRPDLAPARGAVDLFFIGVVELFISAKRGALRRLEANQVNRFRAAFWLSAGNAFLKVGTGGPPVRDWMQRDGRGIRSVFNRRNTGRDPRSEIRSRFVLGYSSC